MMRPIDADALRDTLGITGAKDSCKGCQYNKRFNFACNTDDAPSFAYVCEAIDDAPTIDAVPVIRCKDCKHRPTIDGEYEDGFDIIFPDMRCPCQCDDGWYNWMPDDDWFCGNAERKEHDLD